MSDLLHKPARTGMVESATAMAAEIGLTSFIVEDSGRDDGDPGELPT
jgi:hypothetical protein